MRLSPSSSLLRPAGSQRWKPCGCSRAGESGMASIWTCQAVPIHCLIELPYCAPTVRTCHAVLQIRKFGVENKSDLGKVTLHGRGELCISNLKVLLFPPCTSSLPHLLPSLLSSLLFLSSSLHLLSKLTRTRIRTHKGEVPHFRLRRG